MTQKGKVLFSDMDGTLLNHDCETNPKNKEAIARFIAEGGQFAIATGRSIFSSRILAKEFGANGPCIIYNGAVVYDFIEEKVLAVTYLPESGKAVAKASKERFPGLRITVATLNENVEVGVVAPIPPQWNMNPHYGNFESVTDPWLKVVYHVPEHEMDELVEFLEKHGDAQLKIMRSGANYVEILASNCTKGTAIRDFRSMNSDMYIYAIGDYDNDFEMLKEADVSACPAQALDSVKEISDYILCHVDDGAVAEFIEKIW